jgi:CrcB protein
MNYLIVFLGAGFGGAARHGVNVVAGRTFGMHFPFGTVIVNVLGSLAMGLLIGFFARRSDPGQAVRLLLTTGFLGGFTTFSTFSLDVANLWEKGQAGVAAGYAAVSVLASLAAIFLGLALTRLLA